MRCSDDSTVRCFNICDPLMGKDFCLRGPYIMAFSVPLARLCKHLADPLRTQRSHSFPDLRADLMYAPGPELIQNIS